MFAAGDQDGIDDQVDAVQESAEAAVNGVHQLASNYPADEEKGDHAQANDETKGAEEFDWHFCVHSVNRQRDGDESRGGTGLQNSLLIVLRSDSADHPSFAACEDHKQNHVERRRSPEAANDSEHRDNGHHASENSDW